MEDKNTRYRIKKILLILLGVVLFGYLLGYTFNSDKYELVNYPTIFAHRGIRNYTVENSAESFLLAEKLGFNALEIDITTTKDHYPVIFHDDNCKRLIGIDTLIQDIDYNFVNNNYLLFKGKKTKNRILFLCNFIKDIQKNKTVYFDIKTPSKQLADSIIYLLDKYNKYETSIIADDNIFFLGYLKYKNPKIRTVLEGYNKGKELLYYIIPHKYLPDFYSSYFDEVDGDHVIFLKKHNLLQNKIVYGINKQNLDSLLKTEVRNIIIDFDSSMIDNAHINNNLNIPIK